MADLHITGVDHFHGDHIVVELSDDRTFSFSLESLLTLVPDQVITEQDVAEDEPD